MCVGERHYCAPRDVFCSEWTPHTNTEGQENRAETTLQGSDRPALRQNQNVNKRDFLKANGIPRTLLNLHACRRMVETTLFIVNTVDVLLDSIELKLLSTKCDSNHLGAPKVSHKTCSKSHKHFMSPSLLRIHKMMTNPNALGQ